jgi:hypothetical protein
MKFLLHFGAHVAAAIVPQKRPAISIDHLFAVR